MPQHKEENSVDHLGQTLPTQSTRRPWITGHLYHEQSSKHQNMVVLANKSQGSLGMTMEEEICTRCRGKEINTMEWGQPKILNLGSG
jgi:hypothetical protein